MVATAHNKERLLFLLKELMDNTDEMHDYTMKDLMFLYEENGTPATVKTIRNDIEKLIDAGFKVMETSTPGKPTYYSYVQPFNGADIKLIMDAISAAKFISPEIGMELIGRLKTLANNNARQQLLDDADVSGHHGSPNRNLYATIQIISGAIAEGKKIQYQYYDYNLKKERIFHNNGEIYTYSPYGFAWNEDHYYLLGRVDKRPDIINPVRVDLMCRVKVLDEMALPAPADFETKKYSDKVFRMFGGEETEVTLEADNSLVKMFIDRFGDGFEIRKSTSSTFYATVNVSVSPTFFSWVFQYNGRVQIISPDGIRDEYAGMLSRILSYYGKIEEMAEIQDT